MIEDLDELPGALPTITSQDPIEVDQTGIAKTGDIKLKWLKSGGTELGWIEITAGGTIGNVGSGATLMQSELAHALFLHLWQQDVLAEAGVALRVIPSKGANAEGDWTGESGGTPKQIQIPDCRGRFLAGVDAQQIPATTPPSSTSGRLDAGLFGTLPNTPATKFTPWQLGASGGESVHKLVVTELAVHLHDWRDLVGHTHHVYDPGHLHSITDPTHNHGIQTEIDGNDGDSNSVMGRYTKTGGYVISGGGTLFNLVALEILSKATGVKVVTNTTGIQTFNEQWAQAGTPGAGYSKTYIGTHRAADAYEPAWWHQPTEYSPRPASWGNAAERGDVPHNTLPPFILFSIFMKL